MISLLSIQDVRGHGLPGTPVSRVRERMRRGPLIDIAGDSTFGRDLDRLASRLERARARGADVSLAPELEQLLRERAHRGVRCALPERKRA